MIIWLTGPPGSGKTTVGRLLATATDRTFIDVDEMIERSTGMAIPEIFEREGEEEFRRQETLCLSSIVEHPEQRRNTVVATGGGAVLSHYNRDLMRSSGPRVLLHADPEVIAERLRSNGHRRTAHPILGGNPPLTAIRDLLERRAIPYDDHDLSVETTDSPKQTVRVIRARLRGARRPVWRLEEMLGEETCRISTFASPFAGVRRARRRGRGGRVCVLTDENVAVYYGQTAQRIAGPDGIVYVVEPGERSKSFTVVERIVERLAREGFSREDTIVSLGGGVVTDLGGFVGSIYMRGVRTVAMPTSLLAMVDASVGGKTAINGAGLRNLVGTFRQPDEVIIVPSFLRTLPEREFRSGLVESMKMGITGDNRLYEVAGTVVTRLAERGVPTEVDEVIRLSVEEKLGVIARDLEDRQERRILNFGHTVAHALEGLAPDVWTHGEAVALGMIAETEIALQGRVAPVDRKRGERIIDDLLPLTIPHPIELPDFAELIRAMTGDKKRGEQGVVIVVPAGDDGWLLDRVVDPEEIEFGVGAAWERVEVYHRSTES